MTLYPVGQSGAKPLSDPVVTQLSDTYAPLRKAEIVQLLSESMLTYYQ